MDYYFTYFALYHYLPPWSLSLRIQSECGEQHSTNSWAQQKYVKQINYYWGQTAAKKELYHL